MHKPTYHPVYDYGHDRCPSSTIFDTPVVASRVIISNGPELDDERVLELIFGSQVDAEVRRELADTGTLPCSPGQEELLELPLGQRVSPERRAVALRVGSVALIGVGRCGASARLECCTVIGDTGHVSFKLAGESERNVRDEYPNTISQYDLGRNGVLAPSARQFSVTIGASYNGLGNRLIEAAHHTGPEVTYFIPRV